MELQASLNFAVMKKKGRITQAQMARLGGLARAKKLNPERRHEIASFGGKVSAKNRKLKAKKSKSK